MLYSSIQKTLDKEKIDLKPIKEPMLRTSLISYMTLYTTSRISIIIKIHYSFKIIKIHYSFKIHYLQRYCVSFTSMQKQMHVKVTSCVKRSIPAKWRKYLLRNRNICLYGIIHRPAFFAFLGVRVPLLRLYRKKFMSFAHERAATEFVQCAGFFAQTVSPYLRFIIVLKPYFLTYAKCHEQELNF